MTGERELIESSIRGDAEARKALYCRHVRYLSAVCSRYIASDADVKDVLQEAFIKIFLSIERFKWRGEGSLRSWMCRIVVNESLKFLRDGRRQDIFVTAAEPPDVPDDEEWGEWTDVGNIPPEVIHLMIRELPAGYRTVFNLFALEGRSHREIAGLLGISEASSASQFHRAKKILAGRIRKYAAENADSWRSKC